LAFTSVIDLSNTRPERRTGLTGLGLPAAIVVALRGEKRIVGLLAVERGESSACASGGCSRPSAGMPAAPSRAARPRARWPP